MSELQINESEEKGSSHNSWCSRIKIKFILLGILLITAFYIAWYFYSRPGFIKVDVCAKWNTTTHVCENVLKMAIRRDTVPSKQGI